MQQEIAQLLFMECQNGLFEKLDYDYLMNLNVHVPNSGLINYEDSLTKYFIDHYQPENRSAPSERFAFSGFDITYYFAYIYIK